MAILDKTKILFVGLALIIPFFFQAAEGAQDELIVVASEEAYKSAIYWTDFLTSKEVPFHHVKGSEFEKWKKGKYIVVMGSPKEAGDIGSIIHTILTPEEANWVTQQGNRKTYIKSNVWGDKQTVILFSGYNLEAIDAARKESKEEWWTFISGWFDLKADLLSIYGY